jgi:hypothetical protein
MKAFFSSRLFWFGLVGLLGLAWGWKVSAYEGQAVSWATSGRGVFLSQGGGWIYAGTDNAAARGRGFATGKWRVETFGDPTWYPPLKLEREEFSHTTQINLWRISVCYWLVVLVYGAGWIAATVWGVRRKARFLAPHGPSPQG